MIAPANRIAPPALSLKRTRTLPMMLIMVPTTAGPTIVSTACQPQEHPIRFEFASRYANISPEPAPGRPNANGTSFLANLECVLHKHLQSFA